MNRISANILVTTVSIGLLAACAGPSSPSAAALSNASSGSQANNAAIASNQARQGVLPAYQDPANLLAQKRSVYFENDLYGLSDEYKPMVQAHAAYLAGHRNQKVRIEGNADENGSREYNLALGQRRAAAVRNALLLLGVADAQVEAVSWGKERPKAAGHDETAWAENRRADIKYKGEN